MTKPPDEIRLPISQSDINHHFEADGWEDRLKGLKSREHVNKTCSPLSGFPPGTVHIGKEYRDSNDVLVAVVFKYVSPDGKLLPQGKLIPKALRIDGVFRYVPAP
jgi:hypothetical protein